MTRSTLNQSVILKITSIHSGQFYGRTSTKPLWTSTAVRPPIMVNLTCGSRCPCCLTFQKNFSEENSENLQIIENQLTSVEDSITEIEGDIQGLTTADANLSAHIDKVQLDLGLLAIAVDDQMASISEDILNLNSTLLLQKSQINNLQVQDEEHVEAIASLETSLQSLDARLQSEIDGVKTRLTSVEGQLDNFVGIEEIEEVQTDLEVLTNDFNTFVSTTNNQITDLQGDVRSLEEATSQLQTGLSDLNERFDEFDDFEDIDEIKGPTKMNRHRTKTSFKFIFIFNR